MRGFSWRCSIPYLCKQKSKDLLEVRVRMRLYCCYYLPAIVDVADFFSASAALSRSTSAIRATMSALGTLYNHVNR